LLPIMIFFGALAKLPLRNHIDGWTLSSGYLQGFQVLNIL